MSIAVGSRVSLPRFTPYPRFGLVVEVTAEGVRVDDVRCGDPRCAAEHSHAGQVWPRDAVEGADAYQPRAVWENGRMSSPNTPIDDQSRRQ